MDSPDLWLLSQMASDNCNVQCLLAVVVQVSICSAICSMQFDARTARRRLNGGLICVTLYTLIIVEPTVTVAVAAAEDARLSPLPMH